MFQLSDVWDFHTDIRVLAPGRPDRERYEKQIDLATCWRLGGVFSATGRLADAPRDEQWTKLLADVHIIRDLEGLTVVRTAGDLAGGGRQVLHAEGVYFVREQRDLADLDRLWELGFRSLGPLYNEDNPLGGGARGDRDRGLTDLGRRFMRRAWELGFLIDIAHANHKTKSEMIELALAGGRAVHFTHGHLDEPVLELFGERGLPREQARRQMATGGLIGLSPHPGFVGYWRRFVEEIEFLASLAPGQVVLGSDFSGITTPPITFPQFPSADRTPAFAEQLAARFGDPFARDFCGRSLRRMLERTLPGK